MSNKNNNAYLQKAKVNKFDEFYTLYEDVKKECDHYKEQFKNKVIYCNCDDPFESNFFRYFITNFKELKLKKLICTNFTKQEEINLWDNNEEKITSPEKSYKIIFTKDKMPDSDWNIIIILLKNDIEKENYEYISHLSGDGDFRSSECIELLKEADIVVTNPPFSLFREFITLMEKYKKKYLLLGNMNALSYRETFSLIKQNKLWTGYGFNLSMVFKTVSLT